MLPVTERPKWVKVVSLEEVVESVTILDR